MSDRPELSSQDPVVAALADRIVALLEERGPDRTICPSEAARAVWADTRDDTVEQGGEGWRALMEPAREASSLLRERGVLVVTQRGEEVDPASARGPIRLRRT